MLKNIINIGFSFFSGSLITQIYYNKKFKELNNQVKKLYEQIIIDD